MMKRIVLALALVVGAVGWVPAGQAQTASELLEQAIYAEETEGDLVEAVRLYDQVIAGGAGDDVYVARALYRKAMCQMKAGQGPEAERTLDKLLADFSDQAQVIARAREAMAGLQVLDPASLMPPDMVAYVELGSPGAQLEVLLNMLEGTPLANPLAVLGPGSSGADIGPMGRLLNPSMINEFKKIQGAAAGVRAIANKPDALVVLYPGDSDVLKGVLHGVIGTTMRPTGELEGLSLFQTGDDMAAAFDDHVILASPSMDLLRFAAHQYRNHDPSPSLADTHAFFTRYSKEVRRERLLTAWVDVQQGYGQVVRQLGGNRPRELAAMNALLGLEHVEELFAFAGFADEGVAIDLEARLGEGHYALAYDLVRTPNWTATDLPDFPPDAAAVFSFRIGEEGQGAAQALQAPLRRWTGLDVGRELFANIEQLTLVAAPPREVLSPELPGVMQSVALAIGSHDPARTRSLLHQLLGSLGYVVSKGHEPLNPVVPDQDLLAYPIIHFRDQQIPLYVGRRGSTTWLSLNRDLATAATPAGTASPMASAIAGLPETTGKALLVNLGNLARLQAAAAPRGARVSDAVSTSLESLGKVLGRTHLVLCTEEEDSRLAIRLALGPIPPFREVLPLVRRVQIDQAAANRPPLRPRVELDPLTLTAEVFWEGRDDVTGYQVLLGTDPDRLDRVVEAPADALSVALNDLEVDTVYYGRLLQNFGEHGTVLGPLWSFATPGLMAHYSFAPSGDDQVADTSRHENLGWLRGGARTLEIFQGRSFVLDCNGESSYVEIPCSVSNDFTIALWACTSHPGNAGEDWWQGRGLVDGEVDGAVNDFGTSVVDGTFVFGVGERDAPGKSNITAWSDVRIDDGLWHHLVAVRNEKTGLQTVYVDGEPQGSVTGSTGTKSDALRLRIGAIQTGMENGYFAGRIDDVRLYSYPLSPDAIRELWETTREGAD